MSTPLERARALHDRIAERADEIETGRQLPQDLSTELAEAGLYRIGVPEALGGLECHPRELARVIEAVSYADGATGWCVMIAGTTGTIGSSIAEPFATEIFGAPNSVAVGVVAPKGIATPVEGGYRVSGRWPFGSGVANAQWICGGCQIEGQSLRDGAPLLFFRADQVERIDNWYSTGLAGSGSSDFAVHDAFVPEGRGIVLGRGRRLVGGPLYRFPLFGLLALGVGTVALGIARRAIDELRGLAPEKVPTASRSALANRSIAQRDVATAEARVRGARAFMFEAIDTAWQAANAGERLTLEHRRDLRLAATNAAVESTEVVTALYRVAGGTSVYATSPLQRCFRDVNTVSQHVMVQEPTLHTAGKVLLGLEPDTAAF